MFGSLSTIFRLGAITLGALLINSACSTPKLQPIENDAGSEEPDGGNLPNDSGYDAGDVYVDAGAGDAGFIIDAGTDAGFDAGHPFFDAGTDAGIPDAGAPDAGPMQECEPRETRTCGPCDVGTQQCTANGFWSSACRYVQEELTAPCYTGLPPGTNGVSDCHGGYKVCIDGAWGACIGQVIPQTEFCDRKDNDCDGVTDDNACGEKVGEGCRINGSGYHYNSSDCVSGLCVGPQYYPNGYCTDILSERDSNEHQLECKPGRNFRKSICVQNSQLSVDPFLFDFDPFFFCVQTCASDTDCRVEEGYACRAIQQSSITACLPTFEEVTLGTGACAQ